MADFKFNNQENNTARDNKLTSLVPLEGLDKNPLYQGTTALVKYVEREGRKPKGISSVLTDKDKNIVNQQEGRKSSQKTKDKKPGFFAKLKSKFNKKKEDNTEDSILNVENNNEKEKVKDTNEEVKIERKPIFGKKVNLEEKGYPKKKKLPVDIEIVDGEESTYFNVEKWIDFRGLHILSKIIPMHFLDKLTYNKKIFDKMAPKLRNESVAYNKMTPLQQYNYDKRYSMKLLSIGIGFALSMVIIFMMSILPNQQSKTALTHLRSGNFQEAYGVYDGITSKSKLDSFYQQYSLAMGYLEAKNYDKAKEELMKLEGFSAEYVDLNNAMNEILYQEAATFYENGEYAKSANNLKLTYNYKDSKARFFEASYMSLDELMTAERFEEAMVMLSLLGDYKDSATKGQEFMESLYQDAKEKYNIGLFSESEKLFFYLAQNNYKDSKTMIYQSQYNAGLEYYKNNEYDKAIEQLSKISWFKDASAMLSDMYYKKGLSLLDSSPVMAYDSFVNCLMYRDTIDILKKPELALFGEWALVSFNGSSVSNVSLSFTAEYEFLTNDKESVFLKGLVFSGDGEKNKYTFKDGKYTTNNSDVKIGVKAENNNQVTMSIENGKNIDELTLLRTKPIERTNLDVFTSVRDSFYKLIDKKLDANNKEQDFEVKEDE